MTVSISFTSEFCCSEPYTWHKVGAQEMFTAPRMWVGNPHEWANALIESLLLAISFKETMEAKQGFTYSHFY